MKGILYGVGVGPGDPELMTVKACRRIRQSDVIALPGEDPKETKAYQIAVQAVPEMKDKTLLPLSFPMTDDLEKQAAAHRADAAHVETYLEKGADVAFLTLGDVSFYSTFSYLQDAVKSDGYACEWVSGVPSFSAAAARLGIPLGLGGEPIHIYPALHPEQIEGADDGTMVFMKVGQSLPRIRAWLTETNRDAVLVENCGMEGEKIYWHTEDLPDQAGYYSLLILRS